MSDDRNLRESDKKIAQEGGYSSNQVVARTFVKQRHMSPSDFRETQQ
jgi:AraC-like DNA-binding protein